MFPPSSTTRSSRSSRSAEQKLSDDSGYVSEDGELSQSIEAHIASKDEFRVVAHDIPRPYPLRRRDCSSEMADIVTKFVYASARTILQSHDIQASIQLYQRRRAEEEVPHTYLLETNSTDSTHWKAAAKAINRLFLDAGVAQSDIEVEIVNNSLAAHRVSAALPDDPILLDTLENARPKVRTLNSSPMVIFYCERERT